MIENNHPVPKGYRFAATRAGIKASGKPDLALIVSEQTAQAAGVYTRNRIEAAPVTLTRDTLADGTCQAILMNAGNANACTGKAGMDDAVFCQRVASEALGLSPDQIAVNSTGIIGVPLPIGCFEKGIPQLIPGLKNGTPLDVATAIMTTDSFKKVASREVDLGEESVRVLGIAKGAGMIHPNMGTMLAFILTDATIPSAELQPLLKAEVDRSFNAISVDGDTSTNDTVLLLANGDSGVPLSQKSSHWESFQKALSEVLSELALMIVRDGEGATKVATVEVEGAASDEDATRIACSIATSSLVKTAFFGQDPNWGRIIAAVGYSGAEVVEERVDIFFDEVRMVHQGLGEGADVEKEAAKVLRKEAFTVRINLNLGQGKARYYTSDLTYDYVKINAEYHT